MEKCNVKGVKQHFGVDVRPTSLTDKIYCARQALKNLKKAGWYGEAYIIGSVARGEDRPCSDIDVALCTYGTMTPKIASEKFKIQKKHLKKHGVFVDFLPICDPEEPKQEI